MTESRWVRIIGLETVARLLKVSTNTVHKRSQRDPTFPKPRVITSTGSKRSVWLAREIDAWIKKNKVAN